MSLQAQWQACNRGLSGATIQKLARLENEIIALHLYGGVYGSADQGHHWSDRNAGSLNSSWMFDMQSQRDTLYVLHRFGVYASTNRGQSWQQLLSAPCEGALGVHGQQVYASTLDGVQLSTDAGQSWFALPLSGMRVSAFDFHDSVVVMSSDQGCYVSLDQGRHWMLRNAGMTDGDTALSCVKFQGAVLFAGTENASVYRSTDYGENWEPFQNGIAATALRINCLQRGDSALYLGCYDGCYELRDKSAGWQKISQSLRYRVVTDILTMGPSVAVGTLSGGVFATDDHGQSWQGRNEGMTTKSVHAFAANKDFLFAACYGEGVYRSTDDGNRWEEMNNGLQTLFCTSLVSLDSTLVLGTANGVFVSSNNGRTWSARALESAFVYSLTALDGNVFMATSRGLYGSNDSAVSWTNIGYASDNVTAVGIHDLDLFCASGDSPDSGPGSYLHYSSDYGTSWKSDSSLFPGMSINLVQFRHDTLYVGSSRGLYRSIDTGRSFQLLSSSLVDVNSLVQYDSLICISGGSIISQGFNRFADNLAFLSTDYGQSWQDLRHNLDIERFMCLQLHGDYLFAGILGGGVYRIALNALSDVHDQADPSFHSGLRCFPSPASELVHCELDDSVFGSAAALDIGSQRAISSRLYDALGECVLDLSSRASNWSLPVQNLSNGRYTLVVQLQGRVMSQPILVVH